MSKEFKELTKYREASNYIMKLLLENKSLLNSGGTVPYQITVKDKNGNDKTFSGNLSYMSSLEI